MQNIGISFNTTVYDFLIHFWYIAYNPWELLTYQIIILPYYFKNNVGRGELFEQQPTETKGVFKINAHTDVIKWKLFRRYW